MKEICIGDKTIILEDCQRGISQGYMGIYSGEWSHIGMKIVEIGSNNERRNIGEFSLNYEDEYTNAFGCQRVWTDVLKDMVVEGEEILISISRNFYGHVTKKVACRPSYYGQAYKFEKVFNSEVIKTETRTIRFKY